MPASCSDFSSALLEDMGAAGLLRQDDVPDDDLSRTIALSRDALCRVVAIKDQAAALAKLVLTGGATEEAKSLAGEIAKSIDTLLPRWLVCDEYSHCFVGSASTRVRWAVDLNTGKMEYAQAFNGMKWQDLHRDEVEDLREDVMDVNNVRVNPQDFGASTRDGPPLWAVGEPELEAA